ncbi:MAG TPA: hypothetical protein VG649_13605 [Candidatus Angelobacter sp.]|jgi:hypothetical protein|nr:hypothetical protein [Candidatus Angelobacter sp.]
MSAADVLSRISATLNRAGIGYMLSGSFASAYYGPPRATQDIDIVIAATPDQLRTLVHLLPISQYYVDLDAVLEAHKRQSMFNVIDMATGWKIDFIIRKSRAFSEEEFRRSTLVILDGVHLFVASVEDVIVSKLEWAKLAESSRQIEDVAGILRMRWGSLDHTYLKKWILDLDLTVQWNNALRAAGIAEP